MDLKDDSQMQVYQWLITTWSATQGPRSVWSSPVHSSKTMGAQGKRRADCHIPLGIMEGILETLVLSSQ